MKTETLNPTKQANKVKNTTKLAQTKSINLLNEVIKQDAKEQKKQQQEQNKLDKLARIKQQTIERGNYKRVVIATNNIFKQNFTSLGYLLKIVSNEEQQIFEEQKKNLEFNQFDEIRLTNIFNIIKLARKNSDLYKAIQDLKGIKTKSGNYSIFFLIRTINTNLIELQKLVELQNWK
jgi:anti-sigma28 factor (negative regulator of flagellin synthesis)